MAENGVGSIQPKPLLCMTPVVASLGSWNLRSKKPMAKVWKNHESHSMMVVRIKWLCTPTIVLFFGSATCCDCYSPKGLSSANMDDFYVFDWCTPPPWWVSQFEVLYTKHHVRCFRALFSTLDFHFSCWNMLEELEGKIKSCVDSTYIIYDTALHQEQWHVK